MKKKWMILLAVAAAAGLIELVLLWGGPPPSRQREELEPARYQAEAAFALEAVEVFRKRPRQFARLWPSNGDVYQNAVRVLKEAALESPEVTGAYIFRSDSRRICIELRDRNSTRIVIRVWNGGQGLALDDVYPASDK